MCAPDELRMEQPLISRFNSQSTSRTLVGSNNGIVSPIYSPLEGGSGQIPIVQTSDSKQWIDLAYLSPKILKELQRQYDPSIKDESSGALAKGAAKVKAWVRQSKVGIEIRLRRKLNPDQDEVTDIQLIPDTLDVKRHFRDEKLPLIAELDTTNELPAELPGEIAELGDTSIKSELSGVAISSRSSTDSTVGEPLPRYQPRTTDGPVDITSALLGRSHSPDRLPQPSHAHSSSQDSIIATPRRGLSLRDPISPDIDDDQPTKDDDEGLVEEDEVDVGQPGDDKDDSPDTAQAVTQELSEEQKMTQRLQELLKAIQADQMKPPSTPTDQTQEGSTPSPSTEGVFRNLKVAKRATYETETDVEPPSPAKRKYMKPARKKSLTTPRRKKSLLTPKTANKPSNDSDEDAEPSTGSLMRKQTLPKRAPATAGPEAIWASLLKMQQKIVGPEHPLVHQAKADMARSRTNGHLKGGEDLISLRKSKQLAKETLGAVHPWVAAFSEDLEKLEKLTGADIRSEAESVQGGAALEAKSDSPEASRALSSSPGETAKQGVAKDGSTSPIGTQSPGSMTVPKIVRSLDQEDVPSPSPAGGSPHHAFQTDGLWSTSRPPHEPRSAMAILSSILVGACTRAAFNGISWVQRNYGPEQPVEKGKVRVRWTCSCGAQLHDDFVQRRPGAARELERYLNRPRTVTAGNNSPTSPSSSNGSRSFNSSSFGGPSSSQTSWSSYSNFAGTGSSGFNEDSKSPQTLTGASLYPPYSPLPEPPWLLTCANEERYTPKLAHLDMAPYRIRNDKDLAVSLRDHYFHVNKRWWRSLRLRGLTTIEFVQFEVHQNRFADIRKCPDVPPLPTNEYSFEPGDLLPPVGSTYLLHLFKHPEDYDGEMITYLRSPKKHNGQLKYGVGWGINLVEGFLADRVWMVVSAFFAIGSLIFAIAWGTKRHDVQGASGIAAWMVALAVLIVGWLQAFLG